eukprot:CAMPEP_0117425186 /NCGR_PEP_ID=MMETSP0758-20121206/5494_1 /TAXON_ID=63605 /ORGANISM="Percolomonas cosmopolitus, Strain AE-1 (ATCC 50343)" /LENGTH=124 /DNA_ID=CAMNT_0005209491 /DNA_START=106 /DNA_END=480 /DNA_ORIENTATION=+
MTIMSALKDVLKDAACSYGLSRGINEVCRAVDKRQAHFVVLAENCDEKHYKDLVVALCNEAKINVINVPDKFVLGEMCGIATYDKNMKVRKKQKCSSVAVRDCPDSPAFQFLQSEFKKEPAKAE